MSTQYPDSGRVCAARPSPFPELWHSHAFRLVLVLAFVVRALIAHAALDRGTHASLDTPTYLRPAQSLIAVGRFDSNGAPELARTPGYPMLLAVGELVGGVAPVTLGLQVALSTLTVLGVAALALSLGTSSRTATLAAGIYAFEPSGMIYVAKLLTETLFTAVVTFMLIALTVWARTGRSRFLVTGGVLLAAAAFVRPILYYAPLPMAAVVGVIAWRKHSRGSRSLLAPVVFAVLAGSPLLAWTARNVAVAGYDRFAAVMDGNLLYYRAAGVVARRSGRTLEHVQLEWRRDLGPEDTLIATGRLARARERADRYYRMRTRAQAILVRNPVAIVLDAVPGVARTLLGRETSEWGLLLGVRQASAQWVWLRLLLTALWFPVVGLAVVGVARWRWDVYLILPSVVVSTYLVMMSAGPDSYSRFRLAVVPVISVFAACGAVSLSGLVRTSLRPSRRIGRAAG